MAAKKATKWVIVDEAGSVIRTYSVKIHGKKANDLAKSFVKKFKEYKIK